MSTETQSRPRKRHIPLGIIMAFCLLGMLAIAAAAQQTPEQNVPRATVGYPAVYKVRIGDAIRVAYKPAAFSAPWAEIRDSKSPEVLRVLQQLACMDTVRANNLVRGTKSFAASNAAVLSAADPSCNLEISGVEQEFREVTELPVYLNLADYIRAPVSAFVINHRPYIRGGFWIPGASDAVLLANLSRQVQDSLRQYRARILNSANSRLSRPEAEELIDKMIRKEGTIAWLACNQPVPLNTGIGISGSNRIVQCKPGEKGVPAARFELDNGFVVYAIFYCSNIAFVMEAVTYSFTYFQKPDPVVVVAAADTGCKCEKQKPDTLKVIKTDTLRAGMKLPLKEIGIGAVGVGVVCLVTHVLHVWPCGKKANKAKGNKEEGTPPSRDWSVSRQFGVAAAPPMFSDRFTDLSTIPGVPGMPHIGRVYQVPLGHFSLPFAKLTSH